MTASKQKLREQLRITRATVPPAEQICAADNLCLNVCSSKEFQSAINIALYWPHDHEINTIPLIKAVLEQHKNCYLPVLSIKSSLHLAFALYTPQTPLVKNRYGILEPDLSYVQLIAANNLDIIFMPLLGFDQNGWRLGRGGGFYDATCAELDKIEQKKCPHLIGLAYACQEVAEIPTNNWDQQLDAVVTEEKTFNFNLVSQQPSCIAADHNPKT